MLDKLSQTEIEIVVVIIGWIFAAGMQYSYNKRRWTEMDNALASTARKHESHYAKIGTIESGIAAVKQEIADHSKHDEGQFKEIKELLRENRDDMKQILKTLAEK